MKFCNKIWHQYFGVLFPQESFLCSDPSWNPTSWIITGCANAGSGAGRGWEEMRWAKKHGVDICWWSWLEVLDAFPWNPRKMTFLEPYEAAQVEELAEVDEAMALKAENPRFFLILWHFNRIVGDIEWSPNNRSKFVVFLPWVNESWRSYGSPTLSFDPFETASFHWPGTCGECLKCICHGDMNFLSTGRGRSWWFAWKGSFNITLQLRRQVLLIFFDMFCFISFSWKLHPFGKIPGHSTMKIP